MNPKPTKINLANPNSSIDQMLTENNQKIFEYVDKKFQELKDAFGYKEKLKKWNQDLFKFSMDHRV